MEFLKIGISIMCIFILNSCTFNVSMAHTDGTATDVIDDNASAQPDVNLEIPAI